MDQQRHWNRIAPGYDDQIFDVFRSDRTGTLAALFRKYANPSGIAVDFGCGTGKAFPYLCPGFRNVIGADISGECLKSAKARGFKNVELKRADLSAAKVNLPPADFVFCCNVIMLEQESKNEQMFRNIARILKPDASGVIVVPSVESVMYTGWRLLQWYRREGNSHPTLSPDEFTFLQGSMLDMVRGLIYIDGVPTKHYTDRELQVLLPAAGLKLVKLHRLEYDWNTEFDDPPRWMKDPYPWDWALEVTHG